MLRYGRQIEENSGGNCRAGNHVEAINRRRIVQMRVNAQMNHGKVPGNLKQLDMGAPE